MVNTSTLLSRKTLPLSSVPAGGSEAYDEWVKRLVDDGMAVVGSLRRWRLNTVYHNNTVQSYLLPTNHSGRDPSPNPNPDNAQAGPSTPRPLPVNKDETWAARRSVHFLSRSPPSSRRGSAEADQAGINPEGDPVDDDELEGRGDGLYEAFERGLLERHSEHEKEYIESLREVERVGVLREGEGEVWRCCYSMPPPLSSRTFMNLIITYRLPPVPTELPQGWHTNHPPPPCRQFLVITLPVDGPSSNGSSTPPSPLSPPISTSSENSLDSLSKHKPTSGKDKTVRARYVSVEHVKEVDLRLTGFEHGEVDGTARIVRGVEWCMATSSSAGGNVPQAVTNMALPSKITEDVPAFIAWMRKQNPQLGKVESKRF